MFNKKQSNILFTFRNFFFSINGNTNVRDEQWLCLIAFLLYVIFSIEYEIKLFFHNIRHRTLNISVNGR